MQTNRGTTLRLAAGAATLAIALSACQSGRTRAEFNASSTPAAAPTAAPMLVVQAEAAREAGNATASVSFAELAVTADPQSLAARTALAKAYVASGRFESAAAAYADITAMQPGEMGARFRGALVELARGNRRAALVMLDDLSREPGLAADVGLALALAGEADRAVKLLTGTVRQGETSPRIRQNLALAQALSGAWAAARTTAAVDLSPDQVNIRVAEWAAIASNTDIAWRTATLLGVVAAPIDEGRPVQLAWTPPTTPTRPETQLAAAPAPAAALPVALASVSETAAHVPPAPVNAAPATRPAPVAIASAEVPPALPKPLPLVEKAIATPPDFSARPVAAPATPVVRAKAETPTTTQTMKPVSAVKRDIRPLPKPSNGAWVVQLGSYARPEFLTIGWQGLVEKNGALSGYKPMKSSIEVAGSTYHRLSVGTFATVVEAETLCDSLKAHGQKCFVRRGQGTPGNAAVAKRA